jgi:hypothetical protein
MSSDRQVHDASALMRHHHKHVDFFTVPTIVLAANFFMEVWLSPALGSMCPKARATVYGTGERPIAFVSY